MVFFMRHPVEFRDLFRGEDLVPLGVSLPPFFHELVPQFEARNIPRISTLISDRHNYKFHLVKTLLVHPWIIYIRLAKEVWIKINRTRLHIILWPVPGQHLRDREGR